MRPESRGDYFESAGGAHLQQVALGLVLVGDAEVLLLVPVTLPPGAQAAHASATDGHASSHKTGANEDHIGSQPLAALSLFPFSQ